MRLSLKNLTGKVVSKNVSKYIIDWDETSRSKFQFQVKQFFKSHWLHHICFEEFPVYGSLMKVDLLNATKKIAVEANGIQHGKFVEHFHTHPANYLKSIRRDWKKTEWLESNGFDLIEIEPSDLNQLSPEFIEEEFGIKIY
ncbi:MAG: hypothetical protein H8E05_01100 [Bacteroidetes bacterium]|nr:hypothetical protein [Bacteroidota bacterium]